MVPRKVLIYATSARGLLVFDEPEFPDVPLQVPGGTVEDDEDVHAAAQREFREETGLTYSSGFTRLGTCKHSFTRSGSIHTHECSYFHVPLPDDLPAGWQHHEMTPDGGGAPVLFRFFWLGLDEARQRLGLGMEEYLHRLPPEASRL